VCLTPGEQQQQEYQQPQRRHAQQHGLQLNNSSSKISLRGMILKAMRGR
jgi:hypothetical protein